MTIPRISPKHAAIALCLLCGACEREKTGSPQSDSSRAFSVRAASRDRALAKESPMTVEQEMDAAKQDPLIRQRLADFITELDEDPANAKDPTHPGWPNHRKEAEDLVAVYAVRYPLACLDWIFTFNDRRFASQNLLVDFVMEIQEARPGLAMRLFEQMDSTERKGRFAAVLAHHAGASDIEPLWKIMLETPQQVGDEAAQREIKRSLIGAEAGIDPDAAWERLCAEFPECASGREFIEICGQLESTTVFPVRFLDVILAEGQDVSQPVISAIWRCESSRSISSIETWLERNKTGFDSGPAFNEMGKWWQHRQKDEVTAETWFARAKRGDHR
jgi:hypothetical protein